MSYMNDYLDILIARLAIWSIRRGYGANCEDYEETCASCRAKKVVEWLEKHIRLIKY